MSTDDPTDTVPPWGDDDIVLIRQSDRRELDVYRCLERIAAMPYEEKLRIWNQKQARAKQIESQRAERFREIERLKAGDNKTRIVNYLRSRKGAWTSLNVLATALKLGWETVQKHLEQLNHHVEQTIVQISPKARRIFVRIASVEDAGLTAPSSWTQQVFRHLVADEWVSTEGLQLTKKRIQRSVQTLRLQGHTIECKLERAGRGSITTFYRLVSTPNPQIGVKEKNEN